MKGSRVWINVCRIAFIIYIVGLCYFLFFAEMFGFGRTHVTGDYQYNLELFREIKRFWTYRNSLGFTAVFLNLFGNIVGFIPFGLLLPILFPKVKNIVLVMISTFMLSLCFEVFQLIFKVGCFDVDDLLLNTIGGFLGYIIFKILTVRSAHGR